jgi:transcriptional regulator with XRE-family HTH domain
MRDRRTASTSLSIQVLNWLLGRGYTQADVARMLGLSQGFISLVKSRERGFTVDHLSDIATALGLPLGAFMLQATKSDKPPKDPETAALMEATDRLVLKIDQMVEAAKRQSAASKK